MRKKIELFGLRMKAAVQSHPVEVSLSVLACAMGCYDYESEGSFFDMVLQYMPVVFLFVYTLNRCCARMRRRLLYYFSALLWIPFLMMPVERSFSSTHLVSLIIVILVYLGSGWMKDNKRFVENTLFFVRSLCMRACFRWLFICYPDRSISQSNILSRSGKMRQKE